MLNHFRIMMFIQSKNVDRLTFSLRIVRLGSVGCSPEGPCAEHRQRSRHVTRQQLTQLAFRPPFLGLFTKIQTSIWSEFSGQKGMPCFASSLLDSNRRQRALQILNGPTGQEIKILVETAWC